MAAALPIASIIGGAAGLATATTTLGLVAAGAAIVSGVASLAGESDLAKVAGIVSLGAGALSTFGAGSALSSASSATETATEAALNAAGRGNTAISDAARMADVGNLKGTSTGTEALSQAAAGTPSAPPTVPTVPAGEAASVSSARSLLDKVSGLGKWIKDNKELVQLAGGALYGAFGPEARLADLRERELALSQEELERRRRNANNIVNLYRPLSYNPNAHSPIRIGGY